jgi:hypothetical protein
MADKQSCINEIHAKGGKYCDELFADACGKIQAEMDKTCHSRGWQAYTPYFVPNFADPSKDCYCCCSCFAYDTPIAVSAESFKLIQEFKLHDPVWVAGPDLQWHASKVVHSSGVAPNVTETFMIFIRYGTPENYRELIVTEDHLFLTPDRKLIPAASLKPGDALVQPDGSLIPVYWVLLASSTKGAHQIVAGSFDGKLEGHLLNANGVVTTDYSVQLQAMAGQIDPALLVDDLSTRLTVGSEAYQQTYVNADALQFISNPALWPAGLTFNYPGNLINIPPTAASYLTEEQAQDVLDSPVPRRDFGSSYALELISHAFQTAKGFYPQPIYLYDWNNSTPNAYAFRSYGLDIIVVTGGLVRLQLMFEDGLALILSHVIARLYGNLPDYPPEVKCVGSADYQGVSVVMGKIWVENTYAAVVRAGYAQVDAMFKLIKPDHAKGNPHDRCNAPSIDCRRQTILNAFSSIGLPRCARSDLPVFEVVRATPGKHSLRVVFSEAVDQPTAETTANYVITPTIQVVSAKVDPKDRKVVLLELKHAPNGHYVLTVKDVISENTDPLDPAHTSAKFTLPPVT